MARNPRSKTRVEKEIETRFGLVPNFFRSTPATLSPLWISAKAAYLDNPLPSLFKERLFVHLSRFNRDGYGITRHAGFLLGLGHAAGDRTAPPQSVAEVAALLDTPWPSSDQVRLARGKLLALPGEFAALPPSGDPLELALYQAAAAIYLDPDRSGRARDALRHALGAARSELVLSLITFVQTTAMWTRLHPEPELEPDLLQLLAAEPELAARLAACRRNPQAGLKQSDQAALLDALEERDTEHEKFIEMLGHELRSPVAAVSAVSDMFQVIGLKDDRLRNASSILHRQTKALTRMLDNLLDVSSLAFGKGAISRHPVVIDDVVASVLQNMAPQLKVSGLAVTLDCADRRAYVLGDRARLVQLFENLLSHADKYVHPPDIVRIAIRQEGNTVVVEIGGQERRDTGPDLFGTPFPAALPGRHSNGLGLTIARTIAELHHGTLEPLEEGRAGFTLSLPLLSLETVGAGELGGEVRHSQRIRVLAIEDNLDFAQLFRHMLEIMGCEMDITSDARTGLKLAHDVLPELIFCDIGLPGDMDGYDFARAVRGDIRLSHIPLVAVSGYSSPEDRERALAAGFDRICGKPVKFADISEVLSRFSKSGRTVL
jgi:signal transduction histidine kinase/CheY-like chemotaxis protein